MKISVYTLLLASLFALPLSAQLPHLIFHAELSGSEQIPAVSTPAKGLITIMYSPDRSKVTVTGLLVDLEGDVTNVYIHFGRTGEVGDTVVNLMPTVHFRRLYGEVDVPATLLQNLLPDRAYVSVSTNANPTGEIRGQFICETDLDYRGVLLGSNAVPANNSTAIGFGGVHFPTGSEDIVVAFLVQGLTSPVTEIGIYEGQPGQNGPLVHIMPNIVGGFIQGLIYIDDLPPNFLRLAREGHYYIAIKTEAFPDGELRGQLDFLGYFTSFASINGQQQVPPVTPNPGFAFSHNKLNPTLDSLSTTVYVKGITPLSIDVRVAPIGMVGPVIATLDPTPIPGVFHKTYPLGVDGLRDFAEGRLYVNIPTTAHPNGDIRGQMKNSLRKGYAFDLCGEQVVPPVQTTGFGVAMASVDQANCYLNYKVIYDKLSGPVTEAFVCQAFPTMNGNALYPMPTTQPLFPGQQEIAIPHGVAIEMGETYMILNTAAFPMGEIRGQIKRGFSCPEVSGLTVLDNVSSTAVSPVPFRDVLHVYLESKATLDGRMVLYDILGAPAFSYPVKIIPGEQTFDIPTPYLTPGFYTLSLETTDKGSSRMLKKLIRQE